MKPLPPLLLAIVTIWGTEAFSSEYQRCTDSPTRLAQRHAELMKMEKADQWDRRNAPNIPPKEWDNIRRHDRNRRQKVGKIFGEGCFSQARDYAAAALIFQHGEVAEHYWQALTFSLHGIRLGDESQKVMAANAVDRYLVDLKIGSKQLFARQALRPPGADCWCLRPVEKSFPDSKRIEYTGKSYADQLNWIDELNTVSGNPQCKSLECDETLKPTPQGSVPGIW